MTKTKKCYLSQTMITKVCSYEEFKQLKKIKLLVMFICIYITLFIKLDLIKLFSKALYLFLSQDSIYQTK